MSISYLYLSCDQCGVTKCLYYTDSTAPEREATENNWRLDHDGHEAKVGIKATLANTYDPETEMVVKRQPTPTTNTDKEQAK